MGMQINLESGYLKRTARRLRQESTPAEARAWSLLRGKGLQGLKFRRQHVLHGYIVDFYCHELRLCLELDGAPHMNPEGTAKDKERDAELTTLGYKVLHINNDIVLNNPTQFLHSILNETSRPPR
jgi:very-short-patch-repair endonuclease